MTRPVFTKLHCSACGRQVGKVPGITVTLNLICDDPVCNYQGAAPPNAARDALIVAAVLDKCSVSSLSANAGVSRQRVYQIVSTWKRGI